MTTPSLTNDLLAQLRAGSLGPIAEQLGVTEVQADDAVSTALPFLLGALGSNAQTPEGAQALFGAIERDHAPAVNALQGGAAGGLDLGGLLGAVLGGGAGAGGAAGGLGGLLGGLLGGGATGGKQLDAGAILGHILGGKGAQVESGLSQATGLSAGNVQKLLLMLAPIVMGYLGRQVASGKVSSADSLGAVLGQEKTQVQQQGGAAGGLLGAVLDQNGDGKLDMGDLLKLGSQFLNRR
ncbi:DUF937 domain-containing protein [Lampropedia puyangensis]|uniref:DUF937 domain-containing protein n=1 Tax=Lampropedia puyangensis TaxID=1330072 RepID=A0A4S8F1D0_9BURK|nr:DUF937 domain-containing protein [Lampropedia puyangensis]THT99893.1 DUF937 domain-containing protein [Lampropedia puyangensis]